MSEGPEAAVPPGWEREFREAWDWFVFVSKCERIGWGEFERGPLFVLLEFHGKFTAPAACDDGERFHRDVNILQSIWFSDPELAEYAASEWKMPAYSGEFSVESTTEAGVNKTRWAWTNDAGQESFFSLYRFYDDPVDADYTDLLYWFTEDRLFALNWETDSTIDEIQGFLADGEMYPPMLYADTGVNAFPGIGTPYQRTNFQGTIQPYGDWECAEPL